MERIDLTDEDRQKIELLAEVLNQDQIADRLGFTGRTLRNIFDRDAEALSAYKRGRARAIEEVGTSLLKKARDGDTASAIFYLKTQAGWRETQELELKQSQPFTGLLIERADKIPTD